jgi:hypothetical protein
MLGHKDIKSTQHYARIVDTKIGNDMMDLANRIDHVFLFQLGINSYVKNVLDVYKMTTE